MRSRADDGRGTVNVPFYDGGRLFRRFVVPAVMDDVVDAGEDARIDLAVESGGWFAAHVGRGGDDGSAEAFDEVAAEQFIDNPDPDRSVGTDEVGGYSDGAFIDDGGGFPHGLQEIENARVRLTGVFEDIARVGHQDDKAFGFGALFKRVYFTDGFGDGGVTADAPNGIGWIQDEAAGSEDGNRGGDIIFEIQVGFHGCKNSMFVKISSMEEEQLIAEAWANRDLIFDDRYGDAILRIMEELDKGRLRVASPSPSGGWVVNDWVKQTILLYFSLQRMRTWELDPFEWYDKMELKKNYADLGVRAVPHAVARYGAYLARNVVLMPSYVNIGAYVGEGTMVDTWATVGSCAQIGKGVHLSGGVGIGGVLEPLQASPVIVEDGAFLGSRSIVVEGVLVEKEAVLGANVVLTQSTRIIDVSGSEPVEYKGRVPARSVVIPGTYPKKFPAGEYQVTCALIIGRRKPSTDLKTSLNDALRDFNVAI
jgi:2,3,4,5-tetrahydropyridine-2-carboxylate N-succinyltransferase